MHIKLDVSALSPTFFAMCATAGLLVGGVNYLLFSLVVSRAIRRVAGAMQNIIDEQGAGD